MDNPEATNLDMNFVKSVITDTSLPDTNKTAALARLNTCYNSELNITFSAMQDISSYDPQDASGIFFDQKKKLKPAILPSLEYTFLEIIGVIYENLINDRDIDKFVPVLDKMKERLHVWKGMLCAMEALMTNVSTYGHYVRY